MCLNTASPHREGPRPLTSILRSEFRLGVRGVSQFGPPKERGRTRKHVFLRNEPDWKPCYFQCNYQVDNRLWRQPQIFQSGSFGGIFGRFGMTFEGD